MSLSLGVGIIFVLGLVGGLFAVIQFGGGKVASLFGALGGGTSLSILSMFTDVWQFVASCFTGQLGLAGYLFLGSLGFVLLMFVYNAVITGTDNIKGNFTFWR